MTEFHGFRSPVLLSFCGNKWTFPLYRRLLSVTLKGGALPLILLLGNNWCIHVHNTIRCFLKCNSLFTLFLHLNENLRRGLCQSNSYVATEPSLNRGISKRNSDKDNYAIKFKLALLEKSVFFVSPLLVINNPLSTLATWRCIESKSSHVCRMYILTMVFYTEPNTVCVTRDNLVSPGIAGTWKCLDWNWRRFRLKNKCCFVKLKYLPKSTKTLKAGIEFFCESCTVKIAEILIVEQSCWKYWKNKNWFHPGVHLKLHQKQVEWCMYINFITGQLCLF